MTSMTGEMQLVVQLAQEIGLFTLGGLGDPVDDAADVGTLGGRGEQRELGAGLKVLLHPFQVGEDAGALTDHVDVQVFPGKLGRVLDAQEFNGLAVHHQIAVFHLHLAVIAAVDAVVLQQVDQVVQGHEVVDRHQFQFGAVQDDLQGGPADASHAVNGDFSHGCLLYLLKGVRDGSPRRCV